MPHLCFQVSNLTNLASKCRKYSEIRRFDVYGGSRRRGSLEEKYKPPGLSLRNSIQELWNFLFYQIPHRNDGKKGYLFGKQFRRKAQNKPKKEINQIILSPSSDCGRCFRKSQDICCSSVLASIQCHCKAKAFSYIYNLQASCLFSHTLLQYFYSSRNYSRQLLFCNSRAGLP